MERLAEHEAFLRAIFDAPDDDTPRLVYADFLEENGQPDRAEFIRVQCELDRLRDGGEDTGKRVDQLRAREDELFFQVVPTPRAVWDMSRGFWEDIDTHVSGVFISPANLSDPVGLRERVVTQYPYWYGQKALSVRQPGPALGPEQVETLFDLPFLQQVTAWHLGGHVDEQPAGPQTDDHGTYALIDMNVVSVITNEGVIALARHRGARRIETLILTHNNLDNDAARAIVQSSHLIRLKRLELLEGNRLRGRTWQQLLEKYGENVVG